MKPVKPQEDEIVLLRSDSKLRGLWKLARVQQILSGKDGQVFCCRLPGSSVLRRPLQYLYPLELYCNGNNADGTEDETSKVTDKTGSKSNYPEGTCT